MRYRSAALAAHVALVALACSNLLSPEAGPEPNPPAPPPLADVTENTVPLLDMELSALDDRADSLMFAIQENERNAEAIVELAYLYLRRGWHERAIGPLARAAELEPGRDDLKYELQLALKLSGTEPENADLAGLAKEFVALVELWGHGC